ncbi:MAG: hypothetical protein QF654_07965 [Alphaproteobacteria bacterium]|jgi:hypothetical protein|nr:hypothetical protein [Alphaproteobacteria bacterium]
MSSLWVYWRRPSCIVRFRHGGESALYPSIKQPLVGTIETALAAPGGGAQTEPAAPVPTAPVEDNILHFPAATRRTQRGPHGRKGRGKPGAGPKRRE